MLEFLKTFRSSKALALKAMIILAALLTILITSLEGRAQESGQKNEVSPSSAEALLSRDLQAGTQTMKKTVRIYHYFPIHQFWDELKTPEGRNKYINNYVRQAAGRFWDLSYRPESYINAGPGIYLAIDPWIADQQGFGNTVVELLVPAGTKYLSVVEPIQVKRDTVKALVGEGYLSADDVQEVLVSSKNPGFYRDTLKNMTQVGYEKFRTLVQRVFTEQGVSLIEYNWNTKLDGLCRSHQYSAFVYIGNFNPDDSKRALLPAEYENLPMVSKLVFPDPTPLEQETFERIDRLRALVQNIDRFRSSGSKVPAGYVSLFYNDTELSQVRDQIYSCK